MDLRRTLVTAIALLWSAPGGATDLRLSLAAQGEYDSNVFQRERKIRDDFVIVGIPSVEFLETEGKFTYDVGYQFPYQRSIKENALNDFNHLVRVGADYHLSDRTQLSFSDRFSYVEALADDNINNDNNPPTVADNEVDQEILRNRASFGVAHRITPRLSSNSGFEQEVYSTSQNDRSDNQSYSLTSGLDYQLTERQTVGGGLTTTYQDFESSNNDPKSHSIFAGPYLAWSYQIDEQSRFAISAGPRYVYTKRDADPGLCPQPPAPPAPECQFLRSDSDSRVAGFGNASIDRRWTPTLISTASYERQQDTASGISGSAILDAVSLTHTWAFAERWALATRGDWTKRKSATNVDVSAGNQDLDTQRWGAGASLSYRFTRNLTGSVRYQYSKQDSKRATAGGASDYDAHVAALGLQYALDPIEVW